MIAAPRLTPHWRTWKACSLGSGTAPRHPSSGPVALEPNCVDARYVHAPAVHGGWPGRRSDISTTPHDWTIISTDPSRPTVGCRIRALRFDARIRLERALELEPRNAGTYA